MKFRIVSLPAFRAASSGVDKDFDFSPKGILGKFSEYFSAIKPSPRDSFLPRDFLYFDDEKQGLVWMWALSEDMNKGGNEIIDFEGGFYLTYVYKMVIMKQMEGFMMKLCNLLKHQKFMNLI